MRQRFLAESRGRTPLSAISVMEQRLFLGERLLRDDDVASMAASLEQRVPLVDQVLFENVDRLPDSARYAPLGRKALLRRIGLRGLDPALFERPKSGFVLPFDRWIRRGLKDAMDETLRNPQAIAPVGLDPVAGAKLWSAFLRARPACTGHGSVGVRIRPLVSPRPRFPLKLHRTVFPLHVPRTPQYSLRLADAGEPTTVWRPGAHPRADDPTCATPQSDRCDAGRRGVRRRRVPPGDAGLLRRSGDGPEPSRPRGAAKRLLQIRFLASIRSFERLRFTLPALQRSLDRILCGKRFDVVNLEFPYLGHYDLRKAPPGKKPPALVVDCTRSPMTWRGSSLAPAAASGDAFTPAPIGASSAGGTRDLPRSRRRLCGQRGR